MLNAKAIAATALVWAAGLAATGALVLAVRPAPSPASAPVTVPAQPTHATPALDEVPPPRELAVPTLIVLPTVEIVGSVARVSKPASKARPAPAPRHCFWRELDQGSSSVQVCD